MICTVCMKRDVKETTVRKVVCDPGIWARHRPVEERTTEIFRLSVAVILFITKEKSHLAPGKNHSAYCSPDDEGFQFPALLVNTHFLCASVAHSLSVFLLPFSYILGLFTEST